MNVFLTGATGYVGSRVAKRLLSRDDSVTALVRSPEAKRTLTQQGIDAVIGDLAQPELFLPVVRQADAVIHTAFNHSGDFFEQVKVEKSALDAMLKALSGSNKPLIATSGTGVLGDTGRNPVDETFSVNWEFPASVRAQLEVACAEAAKMGVRTCVLRLPILVYGDGQSQFVPTLIQTAKRNGISYYIGNGTNRLSAVHVEDVADLYILALDQASAGSLYNVADNDSVSSRELAEAVAFVSGVDRVESTSLEQASQVVHPFTVLLLSMNNAISGAAAKRALGWQPGTHASLLKDLYHGSYAVQA